MGTFFLLIFSLLFIDWLTFKAISNLILNKKISAIIIIISGPLFIILAFVFSLIIKNSNWPEYIQYRSYFIITTTGIVLYFSKAFIALFYAFQVLKNYLFKNTKLEFLKTGFILSSAFFALAIWGVFIGRYDFVVKNISINNQQIPKSFNGFKIAQISDLHLGSFSNKADIEKGLKLLQEQNPDIIIITGDIINAQPEELEEYAELFKNLHAPYGKYSILGNHDMGDYRKWYDKYNSEHIKRMIDLETSLGFKVLANENVYIKKGNDSIAIAGVLNWGLPPFKPYGKISEAMSGIDNTIFCVLASHDPSQWKAQVLYKTNVDLMLSGHTHGMQMGINTAWFKWSPVQYKYPQWSGLYVENNQQLYVNQGFGTIGFNARICIRPEITLFTLNH
ncbi:MAG: metallophosphoesterase [Bacteroidota bacterium]